MRVITCQIIFSGYNQTMPQTSVPAMTFGWVGGEPCLDFNNTVSWNREGLTDDGFQTLDDLLAWGASAGLCTGPRKEAARRTLDDALELRRTLHRIFSPLSRWHAPAP